MGFSKKVKEYFENKGLNNREVAKIMDGYSESLVSRYVNSDEISKTFIKKLQKYFPDADINYLIKVEEEIPTVEEPSENYVSLTMRLIEEIEERLALIKANLARKSHEEI